MRTTNHSVERMSGVARGLPLLGLALALAASPARAEGWAVEYDAPATLFLDRSYLFASPSRIRRQGDPDSPSPLLFESQVAPNLFFPQLHYGAFNGPDGEFILSAVLVPLIRLRMLNEDSGPVIPPSFMPKLTLQVAHLRVLGARGEGKPLRGLALAFNLSVGHYSNGQTGCFFANQEGTDPDCEPAEGQLPLNELTGSFSTNYLRMELHTRVAFAVDLKKGNAWIVGGSGAVEVNSAVGPGGITEEQRLVYGDGHWGVTLLGERLWHQHRFRVEGTLSTPYGETPHQRATVSVEAAANPKWGAGFGLFARYVHGQDYYNILFLERVDLWQFGLVFELNPGARIATEGTGRPPGFR